MLASSRSWRRWARWLLLVGGFIGLVVATREALADQDRTATPSAASITLAIGLYLAAGAATARGWSALLRGRAAPPAARGAMYESQLAKYVPGGGVLQAAGQVALSTGRELSAAVAAVAWSVSILLTLGAGLVLATPLALSSDLPTSVRLIALVGPVGLVAVRRSWLATLLDLMRRLSRRVPSSNALPTQSNVTAAFGWIASGFALNALSFATLAVDLEPNVSTVAVASAYVTGWLVGFLLVPLPAGLGAREAVILALLPTGATGLLLAASVAHRLVVAVCEVLLVAGNRASRRWTRDRGRVEPLG